MKITHTENIDGKIVAKGKLVFINCDRPAKENPNNEELPLYHSTLNKWLKPIIISETQEIKEGDLRYDVLNEHIIQLLDSYKILALPEQLSPEIIQDIVEGKLKDGDEVYLQCETVNQNHGTDLKVHYINEIKLNQAGQVTLVMKIKFDSNIKLFTLDDMKMACGTGIDIAIKEGPNDFKPFEDLINSILQKQKDVKESWEDLVNKLWHNGMGKKEIINLLNEKYNPPTEKIK
jgi:hypothetical protein